MFHARDVLNNQSIDLVTEMARRRTKKRTHAGARTVPTNGVSTDAMSRSPKTMVIRIGAGEVGPSVSQLVKDVRSMMEPGTASRLKERRSNRLRDYTAMAGPLGVSHLLLFSRSATGNINLRLALTPRGPTLHFRVEQYSLSKDVHKSQKHPRGGGKEYATAPLLVMNNFSTPLVEGSLPPVPKHLESLTTTIFQSLFPPISPTHTPLFSIRRVLLLNREVSRGSIESQEDDQGSYVLNLRHYSITTKRAGLSRSIKRLNAAEKLLGQRSKTKRGLPNLGKLEDVADYLLDPSAAASGFTSGSESDAESDAGVEILETAPRKVLNKKQMGDRRANREKISNGSRPNVQKRAVKLVELGPRMRLRMTKVEEGICGGKVMWHEYLSKTEEEVKIMEEVWEQRRQERAQRKMIQKQNVEHKRQEKKGSGAYGNDTEHANQGNEDEKMDDDAENEWDSEELEGDDQMEAEGEQNAVAVG